MSRRRSLLAGLVTAGALLVPASPATAAPLATISVAAPQSVAAGERVEVVVSATDASDLYAYDLALTVDTELLQLEADETSGPDGGFTSTTDADDGYTLSHTRRGTSPGLAGSVELGRLVLTAQGSGTTTLRVSAELVGADGETLTLTDVASAEISVVGSSPPPSPDADGTEPDADDETAAGSGSGAGTGASLLPGGGASLALWVLVLAAVMAAAGLHLRRRRAVAE